MRAYPNPADNILTIECLDIGYFDLYDIVGTLVTSITVEGYAQMDVSLLPPGMYELVNRKANKRGQKIMIQ
jgi:hypothetical protein